MCLQSTLLSTLIEGSRGEDNPSYFCLQLGGQIFTHTFTDYLSS